MKRRDVIAGLLLAVVTRRAPAQQPGKVYRIAFVYPGVPVAVQKENAKRTASGQAFWGELHALGFVEGQNLVAERYSGAERTEDFVELAREVVHSKPDVIFADSSRLVLAFKAATAAIPIVGVTSDPVANGIVPNLARPGGNITGVASDEGLEIYGKRVQLLAEAVPGLSKIGFLTSRKVWETADGAAMREAARRARISVVGPPLEAPLQEAEYRRVIDAMAKAGAEALVVANQSENFTNDRMIVELIKKTRLPAIYPGREPVAAGGLMAVAHDLREIYRHAANDIGQILKGANPGGIPYYQATRFEFIINLKAAEALGLTMPASLLARADEVIE